MAVLLVLGVLPFGLLDRLEIAPPRVSATTEVGSSDRYDSTSVTLHAQASTPCDCHIGFYGTLPVSVALTEPLGVAAAGGPVIRDGSRAGIGTADIGVFGGEDRGDRQTIYRLGVLLPSASKDQPRLLASGRVGDNVLELPKAAGVRISTSRILGWTDVPWLSEFRRATRFDLGLDVAAEYANEQHGRIVHVVPRAGVGTMFACDHLTVSLETALAYDPFVYRDAGFRWSTGITGRVGGRDGHHWFQPALTLATVRTPEGWGGTIALDLAAASPPRPVYAE